MKKYFVTILIASIAIASFPLISLAQEAPQNMEEAKTFGKNILERLPGAMKDVWHNKALPIWGSMWNWAKPKVQSLLEKLWGLTNQDMPDVKEEFQKEKQEMQKDLWERFKALF
ncbi:MAG: hypothetical protein ABIG99_01500 [Patescibacteria group bacterium]